MITIALIGIALSEIFTGFWIGRLYELKYGVNKKLLDNSLKLTKNVLQLNADLLDSNLKLLKEQSKPKPILSPIQIKRN